MEILQLSWQDVEEEIWRYRVDTLTISRGPKYIFEIVLVLVLVMAERVISLRVFLQFIRPYIVSL